MSERKNLEHLFQEKLEHFEVVPPEELWTNIEAELKKDKKKRRIIPIWWKLSGIAALLIVGFGILTTVTNRKNPNEINGTTPIVTKEKNSSNENSATSSSKNPEGITKSKENVPFDASSVKTQIADVNPSEEENNTAKTSKSNNNQNSVGLTKQKEKNSIASHSKNTTQKLKTKNQIEINTVNNSEAVVEVDHNNSIKKEKNTINSTEKKSSGEQNSQVTLTHPNNIQEEKIAMKNSKDIDQTKGDIIKKSDSTALATVEPNAMEELLKGKEKESTQKQKINRWQVTPNLAPVYFGSFANGSPLDDMLNSNTKTYNTNMSYGVGVNYAVSKKVKIRTGINVLNVDYDTQGIVFYQQENAKTMKNINPTTQGAMIQIKPLSYVDTQLDRVVSERFDGVLTQKMGYIEMPVELSYKVLDKKFGVELIGGFSTLYLNNNEVFLKTDGFNLKIGEANNLNNIHFSSNFGVGFNYKLFKNFDARIEPSFKYQINTFSSTTEFRPYIFGVYSGVSYRF
ncbi:outer membrane beta-barrel protein [Flavobacterium sp.]|uniref:outer membrane beta-barrel protein n=1 Tax=Flavobacterium sp. TaxID=239 RepID=UPI002B4B88E2|nr:outer membrane beta-barrel protein [Flavobacterium sp.]HLP63374.1 outer membrane beta-barrel protein [Flavobacterium sp.]